MVPILDREPMVVVSNCEPISVIASSLSGKLPWSIPFYLKNNSVLLLSLTFFLLHKQQNVITRMMINNAAAMTAIKRTAWHFSQLAQPPSLQQYLQLSLLPNHQSDLFPERMVKHDLILPAAYLIFFQVSSNLQTLPQDTGINKFNPEQLIENDRFIWDICCAR